MKPITKSFLKCSARQIEASAADRRIARQPPEISFHEGRETSRRFDRGRSRCPCHAVLMGKPRLLLLDEPSLGLSPLLVDQILAAIVSLKANGITVLLVEQNASAALEIADRAYVMETGRIVSTGEGSVLLSDPKVKAAYLGAD